jgi:hypothetical protein
MHTFSMRIRLQGSCVDTEILVVLNHKGFFFEALRATWCAWSKYVSKIGHQQAAHVHLEIVVAFEK